MGTGMAKEPRPLMAGTVINGYRVERELGRGAMAVVYLATQLDLERPVALKVLSAELAADAEFVARFFNEARAAASMSHPHIVQAYDAGIAEGGIYYFCMEFVDGETLLQRLNRQTRLDAQTCVAMALDIADALNFGWQRQKFTHGDIKPENIMINSHEQAKLADFGLAKVEGHDYDGTDIMLTPLYAPPELIRGERGKKDCRSDIYAFGATLYHALAGTPPYPGDNAQVVLQRHLKEPLEPLRQRYPKAPQWYSDLIGRMLEKDPAKRPQSWGEVIEGLKKVQSGLLLLKTDDGSTDGPVLKKAKVVYAVEGKGGVKPRIVTPQERKVAKRTSQGVVTMFILALALSIGTVFLKRHVEQRQAGGDRGAAVAVAEAKPSEQPVVSGMGAKPPAQALASVKPGVTEALSPMEPAVTEGVDTPPGVAGTPADRTTPGAGGAGVETVVAPSGAATGGGGGAIPGTAPPEEVAATPAAGVFRLRVPDVSIPIEMTASQQQAEAMIDAAWCLNSMRYDFTSATPVEPLLKVVNDWLSRYSQPNDVTPLMQYLRDEALPALAEGKAQLVTNKAKVLGRTLTSKRERQFMLQDITCEKIEVQELLPNGHIVRNLSWPEFYGEGLVDELFKEAFYAREKAPAQWRPYLAYLAFTNQPRALMGVLSSYPQNEEGRHWQMVLFLFEMASGRKIDVIKGWQDVRQSCRLGLNIKAYSLASDLRRTRNSVSTVFADVLDALILRCSEAVPEVQAAALVQKAQQQARLDPAAALNLCLLAKARAGAGNFPEKSKIDDIQNEALAGLASGVGSEAVTLWAAAPFVASGRPEQSPERSYVANAQLMQQDDVAPVVRAALPGLRVLSLLEMGDWLQSSKLAEDKQVTALLEGQALFRYPALFGRALLGMRYGHDPTVVDNAAVQLTQLPLGLEKNPVMFMFAPEYALLSRRADREFLYRFRTLRPGLDLRGAPVARRRLQYLDLCLCLEGAGRKEAMDALYAISEGDAGAAAGFNSEILRADAHRMHEMIRLGTGAFYPPMADTALPHYQLRLALACVGERTLTGESDETFMQVVESEGMCWSLTGGDMVYEWLLRRCAADIESGDLTAAIDRVGWVLGLPYSCLFAYYGRLHLLLAGLHNLAGQSCGYMNAHVTLQSASVASETEKRLILSVYERDGGRSMLGQLGYGHYGHFGVPWLEVSHRLGRGEKVEGLEQRFGRLPLPMAERRLVASLSVFQRERQAQSAAEK